MTFAPSVPIGGYAGYKLFGRTLERQFAAFVKAPEVARELAYFRANIDKATSAGALVGDRRLLSVVLGAFGLDSEIAKRAIVRRVLEEPAHSRESFANRLGDPRWRAFARAVGFANGVPPLATRAAQERIAAQFAERAFERAVGEVDGDMRLALNFRREIRAIAESPAAGQSGWHQVLAQQPLRRVVEAAFGLPQALARLDVDRQRAILEEKSRALFGESSPAAFRDSVNVETMLRRFFATAASRQGAPPTGRGAAALALLQATPA